MVTDTLVGPYRFPPYTFMDVVALCFSTSHFDCTFFPKAIWQPLWRRLRPCRLRPLLPRHHPPLPMHLRQPHRPVRRTVAGRQGPDAAVVRRLSHHPRAGLAMPTRREPCLPLLEGHCPRGSAAPCPPLHHRRCRVGVSPLRGGARDRTVPVGQALELGWRIRPPRGLLLLQPVGTRHWRRRGWAAPTGGWALCSTRTRTPYGELCRYPRDHPP